jgi:hypothetical protein
MGTLTLGFGVGTAVVDEAFIEVYAVFRTIGATASVQCGATLNKNALTTTGFISSPTGVAKSVGTANTTTATKVGLSYNGGASASHTINLVQAELLNLA